MFRTIRNSCFGALLLGSCSSLDLSESNSGVTRSNESLENSISLLDSGGLHDLAYSNQLSVPIVRNIYPDLINLNYSGNFLLTADSLVGQNHERFVKAGPLEMYVNSEQNAVGLKLPLFLLVEVPVEKRYSELDMSEGRNNFRSGQYDVVDYSIGEDNYGNIYNFETEEVPISVLGKILKKILWKTELVAPVRKVSDKISGLSEEPTKFIFGDGVKSDLELKLNLKRASLIYEVQFNSAWDMSFEYQHSLRDKERLFKLGFIAKF